MIEWLIFGISITCILGAFMGLAACTPIGMILLGEAAEAVKGILNVDSEGGGDAPR